MRTHSVARVVAIIGLMNFFSSEVLLAEEMLYEIQTQADSEIMTDEELDSYRGGFALPNGLKLDFSFEKIIYQNGIEAFYSYFVLPENLELSRAGSAGLASNFANLMSNSITQNRLDNQIIKTINTINIDISNVRNAKYDVNGANVFRNFVSPTYK